MNIGNRQNSVEFWFEFASNYSYISVMRIEALAKAAGVEIKWKPFLLGPIFKSFGWETSPFVLQKEKGEYMWRDMIRQCHKYDIPWQQPSVFPRMSLLPMRVAVVGMQEPWIADFCKAVMQLNFVWDQDINSVDALTEILVRLELPAAEIIQTAVSEPNKLRLRELTDQAMRRKIFGAPTFFVDNEMFWGNDRLEDALAFASNGR